MGNYATASINGWEDGTTVGSHSNVTMNGADNFVVTGDYSFVHLNGVSNFANIGIIGSGLTIGGSKGSVAWHA
jgi:hypothetical protein